MHCVESLLIERYAMPIMSLDAFEHDRPLGVPWPSKYDLPYRTTRPLKGISAINSVGEAILKPFACSCPQVGYKTLREGRAGIYHAASFPPDSSADR